MNLLHISYKPPRSDTRYILIFLIGHKHDRICGILNDSITTECRKDVLANLETLDAMSSQDLYQWFKTHWPSVTLGYRDFLKAHTQVLRTIPITNVETTPQTQRDRESGDTQENQGVGGSEPGSN